MSPVSTDAGTGPGATADATQVLRRRLDRGLGQMPPGIGDHLDAAARDRLIAFLGLLARWNRAYNLTAVRDPADMVPRHLLDSLAVLPWITRGPVLDAGTGAGLPGIPLAIARPELGFTLLDSNGKKTRFVRQAVLELGLDNVQVVQSRLETYRPGQKFATIVARAVTSLAALRANCAHLAFSDARLLALKGRLPEQEIADLVAASATTVQVHPLRVPLLEGERNLIEIPFNATAHG
ncbi:16S rRNA (guanine(527)-N(7))-methyltransferase RsmG [Thiohalocapsa marina]|uniref:Ribosomal RNA small subunit methyltransferase G n=1 Tax=Thiohalocapsa marina TaxID=424902 RepID=A0A5M8FFC6_9GAMM|nr:16S rRNA (guanine(527)-N(7))-methyltransferase RsmG [Thiohalocapsa marina]KAA6181741.1 16S rRNA (guanine(527)-N(7))-methyltransferase RsmG [Thiohalocapsa marina]